MTEPTQLFAVHNPLDRAARMIEGILVVASRPLSVEEIAESIDDSLEHAEAALELVGERLREGRSGIVLEHVAGGYALRASREASDACSRLFDRPAQRGLSSAALESLAVIAYLGPISRPEVTRIRGVVSDSIVAGLLERGLVEEAGRVEEGGAIRYRTTGLFERIFGLKSLAELPCLDDIGDDQEEIRNRLEMVAGLRGA